MNKTNWKSFGIMRGEKPYFPDFFKKNLGGEPPPTYDENNRKLGKIKRKNLKKIYITQKYIFLHFFQK